MINALKPLKDVHLTLFVRSKTRLQKGIAEDCDIVEGDAMDYRSVDKAVSDQDIVYVNLSGNLEIMTKNIVRAMNEKGAKRIIAISSIGIYIITHKGEPERGTALSRKSIATFVATIIDNPALHKNENLGISKPK